MKRKLGQFFTKKDYWRQPQIIKFLEKHNNYNILDPFAGDGSLLKYFKDKNNIIGYDIDKSLNWKFNNSLKKIEFIENCFIVTNPPYLSKVSNKRKKIFHNAFKTSNRSDLYQIAIDQILKSKMPGIAIVPESFINSSYTKNNIYSITILIPNPFEDTETPVCIICFNPNQNFSKTLIYKNNKKIGNLDELYQEEAKIFKKQNNIFIKFNDEQGKLALVAYDKSTGKKIHFLKSKNLLYNKPQKISSRVITKIKINEYVSNDMIKYLNNKLNYYRDKTHDALLTPFKGNDNSGDRRRRLDYKKARKIINSMVM